MKQPSRARRLGKLALLALFSVAFAWSACEGLILLALAHPAAVLPRLPARLALALRTLYAYYDRDIIQLEPAFARWDATLFYTLRPGTFTFANREFSTVYRVNSLGVRDDEAALDGPEVVVTGDSFAMGWGVEQDETFAKVLEEFSGLKVLNAAVSSYGATRELKLLDRVSFARVKYVVIQHCENDWDEDAEFAERGNRLIAGSREKLDEAQRGFLANRRYWFGRYVYKLLFRKRGGGGEPDAPPDQTLRAQQFLNVLAHASAHDLGGVQLIVFDLESPPEFLRELERLHALPSWPPYIRRMKILDVTAFLDASSFYVLDEHLTALGHRRIASMLADAIDDLP